MTEQQWLLFHAMTEAEWLSSTDVQQMLNHLRGSKTDRRLGRNRKLRLFNCACCRNIWNLLLDERSQMAVEVAERYADSLASEDERKRASDVTKAVAYATDASLKDTALGYAAWAAIYAVADYFAISTATNSGIAVYLAGRENEAAARQEGLAQVSLLRDIFGNPFRPVRVDAPWLAWHDGTIPKIAQAIYDERRWQDMPILADALEEAGCTNADILSHCRSEGAHVRGCWVVDLVLGRQ